MADFGAGTLVSIIKYAWEVYGKYADLGEQGSQLAADVRAMAEQLESSNVFLRSHNEKLSSRLKQRLLQASRSCKITLEEAHRGVDDLKRKRSRTWMALFSPDNITALCTKLQRDRNELFGINQDITLMLSGWLASNIEESMEQAKGERRYTPVPLHEIPRETPTFARDLLVEGRYIDTRNPKDGHTALHDACEAGNATLCALLLSCGANPALPTLNSRVNAVHIAAFHGHYQVLHAIKQYLFIKNGTIFRRRVRTGPSDGLRGKSEHEEWIHRSEKWEALVLSTQIDGQSALHLAAQSGAHMAVRLLLQSLNDIRRFRGGDGGGNNGGNNNDSGNGPADVRDFQGRTPLHLACEATQFWRRTDDISTVNELLDPLFGRADPTLASDPQGDGKGRTALHWAAASAAPWLVGPLLDSLPGRTRGLDLRDADGHTPLQLAKRAGRRAAKKGWQGLERERDAHHCVDLIIAKPRGAELDGRRHRRRSRSSGRAGRAPDEERGHVRWQDGGSESDDDNGARGRRDHSRNRAHPFPRESSRRRSRSRKAPRDRMSGFFGPGKSSLV